MVMMLLLLLLKFYDYVVFNYYLINEVHTKITVLSLYSLY